MVDKDHLNGKLLYIYHEDVVGFNSLLLRLAKQRADDLKGKTVCTHNQPLFALHQYCLNITEAEELIIVMTFNLYSIQPWPILYRTCLPDWATD